MKIIQFNQPGPPEVLSYVDLPTPEPQDGEVLMRAHSMGVGIPDLLIRSGAYGWMPPLPATPGTETSGTIEKLGPGVTGLAVGQNVLLSARERKHRGGGYAEYIVAGADTVFTLPEGTDLAAAAALANYQVAYHMLHDAMRPTRGQSLLVYAAAGGMGTAIIDLARLMELSVIGVVSNAEKAAFIRTLGVERVIDRSTEDVVGSTRALTGGRGVDYVVDPIGGPAVVGNFALLAPMGMLVIYGGLGGRAQGDVLTAMRQHVEICPAVRYFSIHAYDKLRDERRAGMRQLIDWLAAGKIHPPIHARLKLSEARKAHEMLARGEVMGKLLLQP